MRLLVAAIMLCLVTVAGAQTIALPDAQTQNWLKTWIPVACCITNNCCFRIKETDAIPLPGDAWEIVATKQQLNRTAWSPDGHYWRCACDRIEGKWVAHLNAHTRCIFPVMQLF